MVVTSRRPYIGALDPPPRVPRDGEVKAPITHRKYYGYSKAVDR